MSADDSSTPERDTLTPERLRELAALVNGGAVHGMTALRELRTDPEFDAAFRDRGPRRTFANGDLRDIALRLAAAREQARRAPERDTLAPTELRELAEVLRAEPDRPAARAAMGRLRLDAEVVARVDGLPPPAPDQASARDALADLLDRIATERESAREQARRVRPGEMTPEVTRLPALGQYSAAATEVLATANRLAGGGTVGLDEIRRALAVPADNDQPPGGVVPNLHEELRLARGELAAQRRLADERKVAIDIATLRSHEALKALLHGADTQFPTSPSLRVITRSLLDACRHYGDDHRRLTDREAETMRVLREAIAEVGGAPDTATHAPPVARLAAFNLRALHGQLAAAREAVEFARNAPGVDAKLWDKLTDRERATLAAAHARTALAADDGSRREAEAKVAPIAPGAAYVTLPLAEWKAADLLAKKLELFFTALRDVLRPGGIALRLPAPENATAYAQELVGALATGTTQRDGTGASAPDQASFGLHSIGDPHESDGAKMRRLGTDAALWAAEMADTFRAVRKRDHLVWPQVLDPAPGGLLHGWLCAAIEAGRSAGYAELSEFESARMVLLRLVEGRPEVQPLLPEIQTLDADYVGTLNYVLDRLAGAAPSPASEWARRFLAEHPDARLADAMEWARINLFGGTPRG